MSHRLPQIESTLKRALAEVLTRRLSDPRIAGMISITQVRVSPDLHDAYVSVSVLPQKYEARTLAGLRHAARHIHGLVCQAMDLKTVPHLDFRLDQTLKRSADIYDAIRRGQRPGPAGPAAGAPAPADPDSPEEPVP